MSYNRKNKVRQALPSEENVIEYVNEYFEIFETNLKNGNYGAMNTRLPRLIAEKFKKLFELWDENRVLTASMEKKVFEDVYSAMCNAFSDDSSETKSVSSARSFLLECKHCGEEFPLRNNDCTYSYEFHKTSPEHLELLRYLSLEDAPYKKYFEKNSNVGEQTGSTAGSSHGSGSISTPAKHLAPLQEHLNRLPETVSANVAVKITMDASTSTNRSDFVGNFIREIDKNCIVIVDDWIRCNLCHAKLRSPSSFSSHVNGAVHGKTVKRFALNEAYVMKNDDGSWLCSLCGTNHACLSKFLIHCKKSVHQSKSDKLSSSSSNKVSPMENETLVDTSACKFQCPVCQFSICGAEMLYKHLKKIHKAK